MSQSLQTSPILCGVYICELFFSAPAEESKDAAVSTVRRFYDKLIQLPLEEKALVLYSTLQDLHIAADLAQLIKALPVLM